MEAGNAGVQLGGSDLILQSLVWNANCCKCVCLALEYRRNGAFIVPLMCLLLSKFQLSYAQAHSANMAKRNNDGRTEQWRNVSITQEGRSAQMRQLQGNNAAIHGSQKTWLMYQKIDYKTQNKDYCG